MKILVGVTVLLSLACSGMRPETKPVAKVERYYDAASVVPGWLTRLTAVDGSTCTVSSGSTLTEGNLVRCQWSPAPEAR